VTSPKTAKWVAVKKTGFFEDMAETTLSEQEQVDILEGIARDEDAPATARIAALRWLRLRR
jgi:hypothetical protein